VRQNAAGAKAEWASAEVSAALHHPKRLWKMKKHARFLLQPHKPGRRARNRVVGKAWITQN
jgi:hypothetical protein